MAGIALLILGPRARSLIGAIGLATVCLIPALIGFGTAIGGFVPSVIPFAVVLSIILGVIYGTMSWKQFYRRNR